MVLDLAPLGPVVVVVVGEAVPAVGEPHLRLIARAVSVDFEEQSGNVLVTMLGGEYCHYHSRYRSHEQQVC
jgi:hypothetical protein